MTRKRRPNNITGSVKFQKCFDKLFKESQLDINDPNFRQRAKEIFEKCRKETEQNPDDQ